MHPAASLIRYAKPPPLVMKVMEAVCVLLGTKTDWDSAKKVLSDPYLMEKLVEYDKDHIPARVIREINRYYDEPDLVPDCIRYCVIASDCV